MHTDGDWKTVEGVRSKDMATIGEYLQTWKLKFSSTKSVLAIFHLNKEAKHELKVNFNDKTLPFCSEPTYSKQCWTGHSRITNTLSNLQKVDITHFTLEAACSLWLGCRSNNVANSHLSPGPLNSRVLHSCLVWQCSNLPHSIDPAMNSALQNVIRCLHPIPVDNLPILAGIQSAELRCQRATLSLARHPMEPRHLLHSALTCSLGGNAWHLQLRHTY